MFEFYFFIILALGLSVPILLHTWLKRKIKLRWVLSIIEVTIGLLIVFIGFIVPFYTFFSMAPEYPTVTKQINNQYYFIQVEYGAAWTSPGKHLDFYEERPYWQDKKIGQIQWLWGTGDFNAQIIADQASNEKRLILKENNRLVLDTTLNFEKGFDFEYLNRRN